MRITPQDIDKAIHSSRFDVYDRRLTVCVLTMQNGFLVTGESHCHDPLEFDAAMGRAVALTQARDKVAAFLAYAARELTPRPVAETVEDLAAALRSDHAYAWSWHCNIAMAFQDAAVDAFMAQDSGRVAYVANEAAARFMKQSFRVDGYAPGALLARSDVGGKTAYDVAIDAGLQTEVARAQAEGVKERYGVCDGEPPAPGRR